LPSQEDQAKRDEEITQGLITSVPLTGGGGGGEESTAMGHPQKRRVVPGGEEGERVFNMGVVMLVMVIMGSVL